MRDDQDLRIRGYYTELKKFIENQNYVKVIKTANKILSEFDTEVKAWQCKVVAQIHLGEFQEGLQTCKRCKVPEHLLFEKAYCEYRLNDIENAWKTITKTPSETVQVKELRAQILYRLERYDECFAIYRELVKTTSDQFDQERLTNLAAVCVNRIYNGSNESGPKPGSEASYEQKYNYACEILSEGQVTQAFKQLQDAETLCRNFLIQQEGATEEEVNEETAIIRVQQGHCLQLLKREKEALSLYDAVLKTKPDDVALLAVLNNNLVAINRDGNVFDSKKRLKMTSAPGLEHKLTSRQRGAIALNHCLLAYHTNQDDLVHSETTQTVEKYPRQALSATIIKAAQLGRTGKVEKAADILKAYAKENPSSMLVSILSAAQILLSQKAIELTYNLLLSLDDKNKFSAGVVSASVVLASAMNNDQNASNIFLEAVQWHRENRNSGPTFRELLRQAANYHLRNNNPTTAAALLDELWKRDPSNMNTLAQLISAYSQFDNAKAQELAKELPDSLSLISSIDADLLESSFGPKFGRKQGKELGAASPNIPMDKTGLSPPDSGKIAKKPTKKKKKKIRLPKNFVEGQMPDPERWLPRWQRKGFKKRRDRRNKEGMRGTQGISTDAADKFDITKTTSQHKSTHSQVSSPRAESGYKRPYQKKKMARKKK